MSIDASDLVSAYIDEQARVNSALDDGDVNSLVADTGAISSETIGFQADSLATSTTAPPHNWGDGQSPWGFFKWA